MLVCNKYFYKKKKSKLYFGDRVAVLNDFIYQTGGSINTKLTQIYKAYSHYLEEVRPEHKRVWAQN
jgi:hypothetical protein